MTARRPNPHWIGACYKALDTGFVGFERIPHELIRALASVRRAALRSYLHKRRLPEAQSAALFEACDKISAGDYAHHFPLSLWQCGSGDLFDEAICRLIAGKSKRDFDLMRATLPWNEGVALATAVALGTSLSKDLGIKWQILRLTLETKAALSPKDLREIFDSFSRGAERAWEMIYHKALPLYQLDATSLMARDLFEQTGIEFTAAKEPLAEKLVQVGTALRLSSELLLDMASNSYELHMKGRLRGMELSEVEGHFARLSAICCETAGALHAADLGLLISSSSRGYIGPAIGSQLLRSVQLLAEGALVLADRWLMPLSMK